MADGAKGSGSVRERRPGVWEIRFYAGRDPVTGKERTTSVAFRGTEAQALREAKRLRRERIQENNGTTTAITVSDLLDRHLEALKTEGKSPATLRGYAWRVRDVIKPAIGPIRLADLTVKNIDDLYAAELARGVTPATVRQHHTVISGALSRAVKKGWLGDRPVNVARAATLPPLPKARPKALSPETVEALWRAADAKDPERALFLRVAVGTGLRRGEICGLRWSDLSESSVLVARNVLAAKAEDLGAGESSGQHARRRGGERLVIVKPLKVDRPRRIALSTDLALALALHRGRLEERAEACELTLLPDGYIFSDDPDCARPWHPDTMTSFVNRLKTSLGFDASRVLHGLRHYAATELIGAGFDAETGAHRFGHRSTQMFLDVYGHHREARDQAAAEHLDAIFTKASASPRNDA